MGLAASQARLLFITSRQNDVSAKMQRISNQTMILARDEEEISDKYNRMLSEKTYKLKDTDLSYNTLMGAAAISSGNMNIITNASGAVVLKDTDASRYGITAEKGAKGDFAKIHGTVDKFITHVEGDNAANIIAAKPASSTGGTGGSGGSTSLTDADKDKLDELMADYGEYPTTSNTMSVTQILNDMGSCGSLSSYGADDKIKSKLSGNTYSSLFTGDMSFEIASDDNRDGVPKDQAVKNFVAVATMFKDALTAAMGFDAGSTVEKKLADYIADMKTKIEKWGTSNDESNNYEESEDVLKTHVTSSRGSDSDHMTLRIDDLLEKMMSLAISAVASKGDVSKFDSKSDVTTNKDTTFTIVTNSKGYTKDEWEKQLKKYITDSNKHAAALEYCNPSSSSNNGGSVDTSRTASDGEKYACYEKLYNKLNDNGWAIEDVSSIMSKLENVESGYMLDGDLITNREDMYVEDSSEATAKAEAYWKTETAKLSRKEKQLDRELTKLQTEYSALTTDYESVKSIIQQNVTKSFSYCTSG